MKKTILIVVLALVLALGGVFVYVINIDWNKHKNKIAEQFYNSTGKYVVFEGNVNFKIFPTPYLNAVNAKIYNTDNKNEKPLLDIKNINAELALMPLLGGEVNVDKMILDGVTVNINWDSKGLNWQSDLSADQRLEMENAKMVLNSVALKNAQVNFEAAGGDVNFTLDNLNGEVMAQSMFGPFRIEGNYLKNDVLQGFAITLGKLDESKPTSLNAVLTHPKSNSYVRFDGSFQLTNKVLNGNVVVESQKLSDFVNDNTEDVKLSDIYNKPLVMGFDIALNKQMIDFSNIVLKYEETQGAGSIKLPNNNLNRPNLKINFEFADINLDPLADFIKHFINEHKEKAYNPDENIKIMADIRSVRASYNGQTFKDLASTFEFNEKGFLLDNLNIVLPGNADLNVKGNVYSYEGDVFYQADVSLNSEDLMRLLKWMKIEPKATVASVYKKMLLTAKLSGNFDKFQISPYKVVLDNTTFNGDFGMVLGDRKDIMLNISADTLNFDNYINSIPEEIKAKSFGERLNYRFSKLGVFNDFDMVMNADSNLVIYENLPFENVKFKGNILQGTLDLEELTIEKAANTKIGLNGKISGFGNKANFENLQYDIETRDVNNMIEKFGLYRPKIDYNQFSDLKSSGVINGSADDFVIDTKITSGELSLDYNGDVKIAEKTFFNGDVEIKYPETVKFIENLGLGYKPESNNLGLFRLRSKAEGSIDNLKLTEMELNSGYSQFNGNLSYDLRGEKTIANANLKINKFEIEKYLVKENAKLTVPSGIEGGISSFLVKPVWDKNKLNYTPYVNLEVDANFETDNLSYKDKTFNNAKFSINLKDGMLNIPDFSAVYNNTPVKASVMLNMVNDPMINTTVEVVDANVSDFSFGGKTYGLKEGKFSTKISLNSNASSEDEFVKNLKGNAEFEAVNTRLSGINIKAIYDDVVNRTKSEGLVEFVNSQGATGNTDFAKISSKFSIDNGELKIVEGNLSADNTNISASGNCDLKNWTMDVMFDIGHNEPKFLPNYIMSAKSGMNNPEVTFDVSKLFNIFKAKEDQQIAEEKAQEAERKQILSQQINEQKKIIEDLVKSTKEKMTVEIDDKIINSFSDDSKKMYDDIKTEMNGLLETFLNKALAVDVENATSENIEELKIFNTKALQDIEILRNKIIKVNLTDLQKQNSSEYEKIVKINDELRQSVAGYNEIKATYTTRLANIITQYSLDKDENYKKLKNQVDETIDDLEKMNNDVVMARNLYSVNASVNEYEELNKKMGEVLDKLTDGKEKLDEHIKSLKETMDTVIKNEEDLYHKKMEEEENQRLIEENTGSISVKKTGKTLKVIRNIDDIKEANEDVSNDVVKVIDFTKENDTSKKDNVQKSNGIIKKGRINR